MIKNMEWISSIYMHVMENFWVTIVILRRMGYNG